MSTTKTVVKRVKLGAFTDVFGDTFPFQEMDNDRKVTGLRAMTLLDAVKLVVSAAGRDKYDVFLVHSIPVAKAIHSADGVLRLDKEHYDWLIDTEESMKIFKLASQAWAFKTRMADLEDDEVVESPAPPRGEYQEP